jgi:hypothetical protein
MAMIARVAAEPVVDPEFAALCRQLKEINRRH